MTSLSCHETPGIQQDGSHARDGDQKGVTMEMKIVRSISVLYGQVLIVLSSCLLIANALSSVATA